MLTAAAIWIAPMEFSKLSSAMTVWNLTIIITVRGLRDARLTMDYSASFGTIWVRLIIM